jgi:NAD(P)-dependent dehydrogenase (short-subunit alcohol dehydrogenase family)
MKEYIRDRTYVVTGTASGIGAATAHYLREQGARVIACDRHNADVTADLTTSQGRTELVNSVTRLSGGRIDAIAGGRRRRTRADQYPVEFLRHGGDSGRITAAA